MKALAEHFPTFANFGTWLSAVNYRRIARRCLVFLAVVAVVDRSGPEWAQAVEQVIEFRGIPGGRRFGPLKLGLTRRESAWSDQAEEPGNIPPRPRSARGSGSSLSNQATGVPFSVIFRSFRGQPPLRELTRKTSISATTGFFFAHAPGIMYVYPDLPLRGRAGT